MAAVPGPRLRYGRIVSKTEQRRRLELLSTLLGIDLLDLEGCTTRQEFYTLYRHRYKRVVAYLHPDTAAWPSDGVAIRRLNTLYEWATAFSQGWRTLCRMRESPHWRRKRYTRRTVRPDAAVYRATDVVETMAIPWYLEPRPLEYAGRPMKLPWGWHEVRLRN